VLERLDGPGLGEGERAVRVLEAAAVGADEVVVDGLQIPPGVEAVMCDGLGVEARYVGRAARGVSGEPARGR
jgi:hypothetical protein